MRDRVYLFGSGLAINRHHHRDDGDGASDAIDANGSSRRSNWARSNNGDSSRDSNRSRSSPVLHIYQCQLAIPKESKRAILWPLGTEQEFSSYDYDLFK
jgi:hypothetical protein